MTQISTCVVMCCLKRSLFFLFFFAATTIAVFSQQDSLFDSWNRRLDAINFSNIEMLPIYRFTLNEVREELKLCANKENLQSDKAYKQKQSDLNWKINYLSNILEQKLVQIDSLFFAKALRFEQQGNEQEAVFYYKRSLDFNPSYCLSIERLSCIYARNGQNQQHIELLNFLSMDNRLKNCHLHLFNLAFDSLITKSNRLIEYRNYYDALKVLDTMTLFLHYLPQEKYVRIYQVLLGLAQNGIYTSYYDIINKSLKINKLSIAKEYIFGLFLTIENNHQDPNQNFFFLGSIQNLIFTHRNNADMDIQRKRYNKAIETTDSLQLFLNSVHYLYSDDLFFDIYSAINSKQSSNLLKQDVVNERVKEDKKDVFISKSLYDRVNEYVFDPTDFSILDSFFVWKSFLKTISSETVPLKDSFAELKMKRLMIVALSKTNQYAWSNELLKAIHLLEKIDTVFVRFTLQEDTVLAKKNAETTDLVEERVKKYAYEEVQLRLAKAKKFIGQKQYYAAYLLLTNKDSIVERSVYKFDTEPLAKQITLPALFQKEEQDAKNMLEMEYFEEGFAKYEQVYAYYKENEIAQYGLKCDDLLDFVEKLNQEKYFKQLTFYYLKNHLCEKALNTMLQTVENSMGDKQWLAEVGKEIKKTSPCKEVFKKQKNAKIFKNIIRMVSTK